MESRTGGKDEAGTAVWIVTRTLYDHNGRAYFTTDPYAVLQASYGNAGQPVLGTFTEYDLGRVVRTARYDGVAVDLTDAVLELKTSNTQFDFGAATPQADDFTYYDAAGRAQFTVAGAGLNSCTIMPADRRSSSST